MNRLIERQGEVQEKLDHLDAWDLDSRLEMAMDALRCPEPEKGRSVVKVSRAVFDPALGSRSRRVAVGLSCSLALAADLLTDEAERFLQANKSRPFCLYLSHKAVHADFFPASLKPVPNATSFSLSSLASRCAG